MCFTIILYIRGLQVFATKIAHGIAWPEASAYYIEQELIKEPVVVVADAKADDEAVMVHSKYTLAADGAVMGAGRFQPIACFTVSILQEVFDIFPAVCKPILISYSFLDLYFNFI